MPRSWSNDDIAAWQALTPEAQDVVLRREEQREEYVNKQRSEADKARKQVESEWQQAQQARQQYTQAAVEAYRALVPQLQTEFADIKTNEDLARVAAVNPQRAAAFEMLLSNAERAAATVRATMQQEQQQQQAQAERFQQELAEKVAKAQQEYVGWVETQDAAVREANSELADPHKAMEFHRTAVAPYLDKLGLNGTTLEQVWQRYPELRGREFQQMLIDGARWHAAQQKAVRAVPKAPPRAMAPGTNNVPSGGDTLEAVAKSGNMEKYVALRNRGKVR
jgi:hypothetical protein